MFSALTFSAGPALPVAVDHAVAVSDAYAGVYVFSGAAVSYHQSNGALSTWSNSPALQNVGKTLGAARTVGGILAFGGSVGNQATPDTIQFDPSIGDNQDRTPMDTPRRMLGSVSDGQYAYAIGGLDDSNAVLRSGEYYNFSNDSWNTIANMPTARFGFPVVSDDGGYLYTFGGATANNSTSVSNTVYRYDIANNSWSTLTPMPTAVREAGATLAFDSSGNPFVYVIGGATASGVTSTIQKYDITNNSWTTEAPLPIALKGVAAFTDYNDRLEIIGGVNASNASVNTVYVSQKLDVPDIAPLFTSTPILKGSADKPYSYQANASGNPLPKYSLVSGPGGVNVNPDTGLVAWQPLASQVGAQSITIRATNIAGSVDQSFTVNVVLETNPPAAPTNVHVTGVSTTSITLGWDAAIDDTAIANYNIYERRRAGWRGSLITYALVGSSDATSKTISGLAQGSTHSYVVRAIDTSGNISVSSLSAGGTTLRVPVLSSPTSLTATALHALSFSLYASANPAPTYELVSGPNGMTVDPATGLVKWTPAVSDIGTVAATFRATNVAGSGNLSTSILVKPDVPVLSYTINPGLNQPYAVANSPMTIQLQDFSLTPSTYSIVTGPSNMTIDPTTGLATWTPTAADAGQKSVTLNATNSAGTTNVTAGFYAYFTSAPTGVAASNIAANSATINWLPPADASNVASYKITLSYRVRAGRAYTTRTLTFSTAAGVNTVNATGLTTGITYTPRVTALDAAGNTSVIGVGAAFAAQVVTPPPPPPPPPLPSFSIAADIFG